MTSPYSNAFIASLQETGGRPILSTSCLRPLLVRHDGEIDALALGSRREAEVIHGQTLSRAPVDAQGAANAGSLIDHHHGCLGSQFGPLYLVEFDVAVDRVDAIGRDHLD